MINTGYEYEDVWTLYYSDQIFKYVARTNRQIDIDPM